MGKGIRIACAAIALVVLAACNRGDDGEAARKAAEAARAFAAQEKPWRDARAAALTAPDGWTSVIGLHWLERGAHYAGSAPGNGLLLEKGPPHLGMFDLDAQGRVRFVPEAGVALTLDGQPLTGATVLATDRDPNGPSVIGFDEGKGLATIIKRGDRLALRVKHADADARLHFKGIQYWPGGKDWTVRARYVPNPPGKTLPIVNIVNMVEQVPNPGAIEFERDGKVHRLELLDQGEPTLFLVFADRTSGHGSYPAGRYLDLPRPGPDGHITVDFNRVENPPCAFTAFATCPLAPPANRLDLEVIAGEKAYH
ncbi:DUF1684 domain-containing protein [Lysobacter sp. KIS68-7]|uniref:DUF1684 domain-containing protein n=1 Tax=Lysobacter sp. KIS68-7 TaxID=2904252 RepID=UPI0031BBB7DE